MVHLLSLLGTRMACLNGRNDVIVSKRARQRKRLRSVVSLRETSKDTRARTMEPVPDDQKGVPVIKLVGVRSHFLALGSCGSRSATYQEHLSIGGHWP